MMPQPKVEILTVDQMRVALGQLEKIELEAIGIMALLRRDDMSNIFCSNSTILVELQCKIRDFRVILSKNSGGWSKRKYQDFLEYANSALDKCNKAAIDTVPA